MSSKNLKDNDNENKNSPAYIMGYIFGAVVSLCATAAVIGLTIRFLLWLF